MTRVSSEIESKITELVAATLNVDQAIVRRDRTLAGDLGADSLDSVALILALEDEFRIDIHEEAAELLTVGQMIEYVIFALAAPRSTGTGHSNSGGTLSLR